MLFELLRAVRRLLPVLVASIARLFQNRDQCDLGCARSEDFRWRQRAAAETTSPRVKFSCRRWHFTAYHVCVPHLTPLFISSRCCDNYFFIVHHCFQFKNHYYYHIISFFDLIVFVIKKQCMLDLLVSQHHCQNNVIINILLTTYLFFSLKSFPVHVM